MPDVQHNSLSGAELHEPKGVSGASSNETYVADGAGSGSWAEPEPKGIGSASAGDVYVADGAGSGTMTRLVSNGCLRCNGSGDTTGISTSFQPMNTATIGGSLTWAENQATSDITTDTTDGHFIVTEAGEYFVTATINFIAATADTFTFTIGIDTGNTGTITEQSTAVQAIINTTSTTDTVNCVIGCIPSLGAGDALYLMVKSASGNELEVTHINFTLQRIG